MVAQKIFVGGWFQRTTLHLSEIYDFLVFGTSPLDLDPKNLAKLQKALNLKDVSFHVDHLEYIKVVTEKNITVKLFEDGLIVLDFDGVTDTEHLAGHIKDLTDYYEKKLSPAISYLFSLGAPIPKELANIKAIYPYFIILDHAAAADVHGLMETFKQKEYFQVTKERFEIYRGDKLYIINSLGETLGSIEKFVQEQIFLREFKGQLHRYLNLHRIIWERIADVKEKGSIRGNKIGEFIGKIESYDKTINLIEARINQMGTYISTRGRVVESDPELKDFADVLLFKHETLEGTLSYIKDIWGMTKNYVKSSMDLFSSLQAQSTESSITNLSIITSMGVGATLIGLFSNSKPEFTSFGVLYFFILAAIGWGANRMMKHIAQRKKYTISDVELSKDL